VYYGGTYYTSGPFDHEFAGFSSIKATDPAGNVTKTYYDTSNGTSTSLGQYNDNFWKIGKAYRTENYDANSKLYKTTITKWDSASLGGNAAYVFPDQMLEMDYDGLATHQELAESYTWNTATGNQTQKIQWGQVTGTSTGAFSTSTNGLVTNLTYASTTGSNVIGKVSDETLLNPSSTKIQETQYYYDGLSLGNIGAGNLTKQLDWKSGSTYVTSQNTYNSYGLLTQTLDPRNNTTTYAYDSYNLYPATTTNALNQATNNQYDYSTGKITKTIDPNKLTFLTSYDGVGRPLQVLQPDQTTTSTLDTKTTFTYTDTSNAVSVHESDYLNSTTTVDTYTYYDGLNRLIQTRKSATDAGMYKVTDRSYNNRGLLQSASLPYFASGGAYATPTTTAALFANYTYDPLGRVLTTVNAVGTVSDAYTNWKTTITDANGNPKDEYHDAFGNLVQVAEHNGSSTYNTYYTYDGLHDLLNLTDANSNLRNFAYDGLGRMVSSTDLHAATDSTYGVWNYTYDDAGNLSTRVDPKNQTVNWTYDGLNRMLTEDFTGATGTEITDTYDTCTNGIGRLCTVSSTNAVSLTTKTYDALGNLASEAKTISGTTYTTNYTYDRQGNQLTITNPDNSVVYYTYGTAGLPTSVVEQESGSSSSTIISSIDYSPTDQIAIETYANGMVAKNIYDPLQLYRLVGKVTTDNQGQMSPHHGGGFGPLTPGPGLNTSFTFIRRYLGAVDSFTIPMGVASLTVSAYGAQGGGGGGLGGAATGTLSVTSGTTYYFVAGGVGANGSSSGGGPQAGNGGGGMSWFSSHNSFDGSVLLVAGGGGGNGGSGSLNSGGSFNGALGGYGGGGNGGNNGGGNNSGSGGGGGGYWGGYAGGSQSGGTAATQSSGYAQGQGGAGTNGGNCSAGGGGGGGGGLAGANGTVSYSCQGFAGSGGGGGGSSFMASTLTATSTATSVNPGNGYFAITELPANPVVAPYLSSQNQYHLDGVTQLNAGSSTTEGGATFKATLNSSGTLGLQLQVEVEPIGKNFTNIANVTATAYVAPNQVATTTFYGLNGSYHWQAQVVDSFGNSSGWQRFSSSTYATDFSITSQSVPTNATITYSGSIGTFTVPSDVSQLTLNAYGAQGAPSSTSTGITIAPGGYGGRVSYTMQTVPGSIFYYFVGGQGGSPVSAGDMTWISPTSTFSTSTVWAIAGGGGNGGTQISGGCSSNVGGSGGTGGGLTAGSGNNGGGNGYGVAAGGGGGTQSAGGGGGSGGTGYLGSNGGNGMTATSTVGAVGGVGAGCGGGSGGAGGSGYFGGGGGGGGGGGSTANGFGGGGGGGGGSSYVFATSSFINTSTASGVNPGNGYISITEYHTAPIIASLNQYHLDGATPINTGSSTTENGAVFASTLTSNTTSTMQLQVEVEPAATNFLNAANVTSSAWVSTGGVATTSYTGQSGSYHWQARALDSQGNSSAWHPFVTSNSSSGPLELYATPLFTDANLVSYYRMEGNASDAKGANNGSGTNVLYNKTYGMFGKGANFNGSSSVLSAFTSSPAISGTYSVNLWFQTNNITGGSDLSLFSTRAANTAPYLDSQVGTDVAINYPGSGGFHGDIGNGTSWLTTSANASYTLATGTWYMFTAVYATSGWTYYVNGSAIASGTYSGTPLFTGSSNELAIGNVDLSSGYWLNGDIDDFSVFSRALTASEISNLYTGQWPINPTAFVISNLYFTYPVNGTTVPQFSNWQLKARNVTSTNSYKVQVGWGLLQPNEATSSISASGTQLLSGVNVPKQLYPGDYSDTGDPVPIIASGTLTDITSGSTLISSTTVSFNEKTIAATSNCNSQDLQCIAYTYDANGNITKIVDNSANNAAITVNYTYDGLNRLLSASSSNATSGPNYAQNFAYDPLGNPLTGPAGTYTYGQSGYADPDAVTSISNSGATSTISFVQAIQGNLSGTSATSTLTGVTAGNLLMVENNYTGSMTSSPLVDDAGTLTFVASTSWHGGTAHSYLYYEKNAAAGSHDFHITYGSAPSYPSLNVAEYSGASTSSPLDTFGVATGTGDPVTIPALTSAGVNEMAFGFGNAAGATLSSGTGFTLRGSAGLIEDNATSTMAAGTAVSTTFFGSSGADWVDIGALIKPAPGNAGSGTVATFAYDNDGNVLSTGNATDTWDYRNELTQVLIGGATSTYGYDYTGERVQVAYATSTTYYPETTYTVNGATKTKNIFAGGTLVATIQNSSGTSGYQFYRTITVTSSASIASGTLANFPMLVSSTISSWASASHGGHIQNLVTAPNGRQEPADLVFATSSANCNTAPLNFETESYTSSTGALIDWVTVPSMSTGTVIYACYGNSSLSTDQTHPSSTWNSNYVGVWHLATTTDSTANGYNTTIQNGASSTNNGIVDGAFGFNGSNSYLNIPSTSSVLSALTSTMTIAAWVNTPSLASPQYIMSASRQNSNSNGVSLDIETGGALHFTTFGVSDYISTGAIVATGTWKFVTVSFSSGTASFYLNGSFTDAQTGGNANTNTGDPYYLGASTNSGTSTPARGFNGRMDEISIAKVALSSSWILTQYNNQNSPSTFYTVGSETSGASGSSTATTYYVLGDNLNGTNVLTNTSGTVAETLSYYPYGAIRIDNKTGSYAGEDRKYIGQQYDAATQLSYLKNRYYSGSQGQFLSEDPAFLAIGNPNKVQQLTSQNQSSLLANPQSLNVYSYSQDNPITKSDPNGNWLVDINFSFLIPLWQPIVGAGPTKDLIISQEGIYEFQGGSVGAKPGPGGSISFSTANPSPGWSSGYSICPVVCYSKSFGSDGATEWGIGTPGVSVSGGYTKQLISFGPAVYNIYPNQAQTNQSIQNVNQSFGRPTPVANSASTISYIYNSTGGSGSPNVLSGQNPASKYTFSGGVNAYGESYSQVFPAQK